MSSGIPSTYVPARNTIFLSFAFSYADAAGAEAVVIGANAVDYSGYPDCRPDYLKSMERSAKLGTRSGSEGRGIRILSPLVHLSKAQIIRLGNRLGVPYGLTWSCYQGGKRPCGRCDSCLLREKGFQEAGVPDPLVS
jgi:7-cyano-7-deazaguanine synthase